MRERERERERERTCTHIVHIIFPFGREGSAADMTKTFLDV